MVFRNPFGVTIAAIMGCARLFGLSCGLTRGCGASSLVVSAGHGDVVAVGFATGSGAGLANSRDGGIPTKGNSAVASNEARKAKMSERALKSLRDRAPSKLKVPGSNPGEDPS